MCTVTFLPLSNTDFILTSNRDEQKQRETLPPKTYIDDGVELFFPKDKLAGGTWIGTSSKKRLICVLNGAFIKHKRNTPYKKSRGVIAKELLKTTHLLNSIEQLDLTKIEPFTMVIVDWNHQLSLYELIWDNHKKHFSKLENKAKIWSSSTLYTEEVKETRKHWFQNWLQNNEFSTENILKFHHSEIGEKEQSILMKRKNVETVSITSVKKTSNTISMLYEDIVNTKTYQIKLPQNKR